MHVEVMINTKQQRECIKACIFEFKWGNGRMWLIPLMISILMSKEVPSLRSYFIFTSFHQEHKGVFITHIIQLWNCMLESLSESCTFAGILSKSIIIWRMICVSVLVRKRSRSFREVEWETPPWEHGEWELHKNNEELYCSIERCGHLMVHHTTQQKHTTLDSSWQLYLATPNTWSEAPSCHLASHELSTVRMLSRPHT